MLCWGGDFVFVSTGKENLCIVSKVLEIRFDWRRSHEGLVVDRKKKPREGTRQAKYILIVEHGNT